MNRKLIPVIAIVLVAAVVLTVFLLSRNHTQPEASETVATTTTTRSVKVPNIIEDSEPDSAATTETELQQIDITIQTGTLETGYTLPVMEEPADIPPDDTGMTG